MIDERKTGGWGEQVGRQVDRHYKELVHTIMEAGKSAELAGGEGDPWKAKVPG